MTRRFALPYRWSTMHQVLWPGRGDRTRFTAPRVREYHEVIALLDERDFALEDYVNQLGSRPYSTVLVAAVNSYAAGHETADFVCDGVADDVTINEALALCVGNQGRVLLLEGDYTIEDTITITDATLAGLGRDVTRLSYVDGVGASFEFSDGVLEDLSVTISDGYGWDVTGYTTAAIRRCRFYTSGGV